MDGKGANHTTTITASSFPELLNRAAGLVPLIADVDVLTVHIDRHYGVIEVHVSSHDRAGAQSLVNVLGLTTVTDSTHNRWLHRLYSRVGVPVTVLTVLPVAEATS